MVSGSAPYRVLIIGMLVGGSNGGGVEPAPAAIWLAASAINANGCDHAIAAEQGISQRGGIMPPNHDARHHLGNLHLYGLHLHRLVDHPNTGGHHTDTAPPTTPGGGVTYTE